MSNIFDTYWIRTNRLYGKRKTDNSIVSAKGVFRWEQNKFVPVEKMFAGNANKELVEVWYATPSEYEFEIKPQYNFQTIPYNGGLFECFVINSKNAGFLTFGKDNIQILGYNETGVPPVGLSVADVIFDDVSYEHHKHVVTFRFTENTTSSAKYWTVKFIQPESGNELTLNCIQAKNPNSGGGTTNAIATIDAYFLTEEYSAVRATVELNSDAITLAKTNDVIVELQNISNDPIDSYTNEAPVDSYFENTLHNSNFDPDVWVVVKCNNIELGRRKVDG